MGTNNSSNEISFQIYDKLLNLVHLIKENNPNCHVMSSPIDRLHDGKAALTVKRLNSLLTYIVYITYFSTGKNISYDALENLILHTLDKMGPIKQ